MGSKELIKGGRKTPLQIREEVEEVLKKFRQDKAKKRLGFDSYRDKKFLKFHQERYDYYIFEINRDIIARSGTPDLINIYGDNFKKKDHGKIAQLFMELKLYGHLLYYDFKPYPIKELKKMKSYIKTLTKSMHSIKKQISKHYGFPSTIKKRYILGLGKQMQIPFQLDLAQELLTIEEEMILLTDVIDADMKIKDPVRNINFKAKAQYYFYLCHEIFLCTDFNKMPDFKDGKINEYKEAFYLRMTKELDHLQHINPKELINSIYLRPEEKKYKVTKFHNLMGCRNLKDFDKIKKAINF